VLPPVDSLIYEGIKVNRSAALCGLPALLRWREHALASDTRSLVYDCGTPHLFKLSVRDVRIDGCGDQSKCSYHDACRRPPVKLFCYA